MKRLVSGGSVTGVLWMLADNQGTVRDLLDNSGQHVEHIAYDSFGNIKGVADGGGTPISGPSTRYAYTGREWDAAVDMYYYRARYYDAATGRFASEDPISFGGGDYNLGRYVGNSPTNGTDPSGKIAPLLIGGAVILVYSFWPDTANAPAPNEPTTRSNPYAGLPWAVGAGLGVGGAIAAYRWWAAAELALDECVCAAPSSNAIEFPPNRGFAESPGRSTLVPGARVDRYGGPGGSFLSPSGTPPGARALPPGAASRPLNGYEVIKPIEVNAGRAARWFGQPGGGTQFDLGTQTVQDLINSGHLRPLR